MNAPVSLCLGADLVREARRQAGEEGALGWLKDTLGLTPPAFLGMLAEAFAYPAVDMAGLRTLQPAFELVPYGVASEREAVACRDPKGRLWLVITDPLDPYLLDWAEHRIAAPFGVALASTEDFGAWLHQIEDSMRAMDRLSAGAAEGVAHEQIQELSLLAIDADSSPVVKLVHSTLYDALSSGTSDIHLENDAQGLAIRYRIDGVLNTVARPTGRELAEQVISRVKVMAELDIAERRVPQDGRFKVRLRDRDIDLRVSIMPGVFGEDAVLRVLDRRQLADGMRGINLDQLGCDPVSLAKLRKLSNEPYGMILVTGPTGSGKTTTLYAAISEINDGQNKIVTIEDPVEYQLPGVLQIPVNEKKGLTFARGLRSILRHDPDKIMVGEIRDLETAQIAVQSALTGHLVFTTVHANNVFDVIGRFMHMGVDPYSFVTALNGILAQRLVRINCPHCAEPQAPAPELLASAGLSPEMVAKFGFKAGKGCGHCRGTGYRGRKAVAEVMLLDDEIRELIVTRAPIRKVKEAASRAGLRSMRQMALELVRRGETTLQEVNRVTAVA